uniref:Uncharacterized protein n=1 Tax=Tanacetum cinerariifolium TaxID=118510 RepID=A0A699HCS2_TANCI|nr:hypothetical protein [Tanacetum cinerariifolium]
MVTSAVEKTNFASKRRFRPKLIDDLDEPVMDLKSDGTINKSESFIAPVKHKQTSVGKKNRADKMFTRNIIKLKLGCEICLGHLWINVRLKQKLVPAQRRTCDP